MDAHTSLIVAQAIKLLCDRKVDEQLTDAESHHLRPASYDPGSVFLLEMMTSLAVRSSEAIEELWYAFYKETSRCLTVLRPTVFDHLNDLLSRAASHSTLLVERAVVSLIRLCGVVTQQVGVFFGGVSVS